MKYFLLLFILCLHSYLSCAASATRRHDNRIIPRVNLMHHCDDPRQVDIIAEALYGAFMLSMLAVWTGEKDEVDAFERDRFLLHFGRYVSVPR